jgi:hypothetical protein
VRLILENMSATLTDDIALTLAAQGGDLDAFETLVREHTPAVYARQPKMSCRRFGSRCTGR